MTRALLSASALALMFAAPAVAQDMPADPAMPPMGAEPAAPAMEAPSPAMDMPAPSPEAAAPPAAPAETMPPAAAPEAGAATMSTEAAQTPADWAKFDMGSKGYLTALEFGNWLMAKQGNDMSAEVEKTKTSKKANLPAVQVLNATGTAFLKADTNGDRRITPDELATAVAG